MNKICKKGISTIEMLVVIAIVGFLVILIAAIPNSINLIGRARHQSLVREIISKRIEDVRGVGYINLANGTQPITDQRLTTLPSGSGQIIISDCDPQLCINGENIKKITISISWNEYGKSENVKVDTFMGEGGLN